jgi:HAD superfamily hydrolase (TIGR01549 family)
MAKAVILDVDGTLVDTNYQHALCWSRAFREQRIVIPVWRLHRGVGMGGDKYVEAMAGADVEGRLGEALRERWAELFDGLLDEIEPFDGARELLVDLHKRGRRVVLASSSIERHLDRFLDLLDAREVVDAWTTKDDVEASKPDPDLVEAALERAGTRDAVMVGDTPWDVDAARKAGIETICVLTGGFSEAELREAGAAEVVESVADLRGRLRD